MLDIYNSPSFVGILYFKEEEIKGAIFGNCEQWYEGFHFNLKEMFVSNELQGMGMGRELLKSLEEKLRVMQVGTIILFTSKGNLTSEFYIKNGFKELGFMAMMDKNI
ncbi:GCN5-related N-acetyltransferase [Pseudobacteroides cellulosolvens ATCC 35603 = DSM 2933]|uniref:GCN5-related N-acetyltransferase n=1 Tax=Pseudobacteroides cellulosolvens ATCC 35603 = DSM 2933 TaxID=398512 RepID=A0A0L6JI57_9FIRM|nr:GNAT family N-acetyltransferase [Pseudobacteroides cellulosolvens]KNY25536.1 GCN5-related N-acetyltransferase [Pseudobacteroides cellulosolvens ATCC 35603 = DSM 2933]